MSHYISTFLYEPIARQARRFSSPALAGPSEHGPPYHGTNSGELVHSQRILETRDSPVISSEDESAIFPVLEPPVLLSPMVEDDALDEAPGSLGPWNGAGSDIEGHFTFNDQNIRDSAPSRPSDTVGPPPEDDAINRAANPVRDRNQSTNSRSDSLQEAVMALNGGTGRSRANTDQDSMISATSSSAGNIGDGILPEDDGMGVIRKEIIQIQSMDTTNSEKSRRMHELMTRRYSSYHSALPAHQARAHSPGSLQGPERSFTPSSGHSHSDVMHSSPLATSVSSIAEQEIECRVTADDLVPTYYVPPNTPLTMDSVDCSIDEDAHHHEQDRPLGCAHYKRNVKLQCSACNRWYTCRFCHDAVEDHSLNRRETKNMLCMLCGCAQPAAEECRDCGERGAWYYCGVCKLWDDDPQKNSYKCPICSRSMMNMEMQFRHLDRSIETQPMPEQFRDTKAWVYCNDCSAKTEVKYHWLGLKCAVCDSYNTAQISITSMPRVNPEEAASHVAGAQLPDAVNLILPDAVQAFARGRSRGTTTSLHRSATANPEMETGHTRPTFSRRTTQSASGRVSTPAAVSEGANTEDESADEEDDVDFWGGESPRDKALPMRAGNGMADTDESDEEDEDEDDTMDDDLDTDDDDEEDDHMELFGHR
ncbi:hypothetical protein MMC30_000708 [Trapelia coarctata]|nr:hypothetical protein [Trapelia coarctata]